MVSDMTSPTCKALRLLAILAAVVTVVFGVLAVPGSASGNGTRATVAASVTIVIVAARNRLGKQSE